MVDGTDCLCQPNQAEAARSPPPLPHPRSPRGRTWARCQVCRQAPGRPRQPAAGREPCRQSRKRGRGGAGASRCCSRHASPAAPPLPPVAAAAAGLGQRGAALRYLLLPTAPVPQLVRLLFPHGRITVAMPSAACRGGRRCCCISRGRGAQHEVPGRRGWDALPQHKHGLQVAARGGGGSAHTPARRVRNVFKLALPAVHTCVRVESPRNLTRPSSGRPLNAFTPDPHAPNNWQQHALHPPC